MRVQEKKIQEYLYLDIKLPKNFGKKEREVVYLLTDFSYPESLGTEQTLDNL